MRMNGLEWTTLAVPFLLFWVVPAFLVARAASRKSRSYWGFLVISLIIGWLIPAIVVLAMKREPKSSGRSCPFCAEQIQFAAILCPHCHQDLGPAPKPDPFK